MAICCPQCIDALHKKSLSSDRMVPKCIGSRLVDLCNGSLNVICVYPDSVLFAFIYRLIQIGGLHIKGKALGVFTLGGTGHIEFQTRVADICERK